MAGTETYRDNLSVWRGRFRSDAMEEAFRRHTLDQDKRRAIFVLGLMLLALAAFIPSDYLSFGWSDAFLRLLAVRLGVLGIAACALAPLMASDSYRVTDALLLALTAVLGLAIVYLHATRPETPVTNSLSDLLYLICLFILVPNRFVFQAASGLFFAGASIAMHWAGGETSPSLAAGSLVMPYALAIAIGTYTSLRYHLIRRIDFFRRENQAKQAGELRTALKNVEAENKARRRAEAALNRANRILNMMSKVDGLTQVANRRWFEQCLASEWRRAQRTQAPLAVMICDIDFFKQYNNTFGHQAGDRCLKTVAAQIQKQLKRPGDFLARYGGEEFALILPHTPGEGALYLGECIRQAIANLALPASKKDPANRITVSIGVSACIPNRSLQSAKLFAAADDMLYQAKARGRNRVEFKELSEPVELLEKQLA